jgi:hypothetical protein
MAHVRTSSSSIKAALTLTCHSPTLAFIVFGSLSCIVSLFLVETMANIHGNNSFQARVEYSTIAHLYLGQKSHIVMQVLLYCALQSVNISSIIISNQVRDNSGCPILTVS